MCRLTAYVSFSFFCFQSSFRELFFMELNPFLRQRIFPKINMGTSVPKLRHIALPLTERMTLNSHNLVNGLGMRPVAIQEMRKQFTCVSLLLFVHFLVPFFCAIVMWWQYFYKNKSFIVKCYYFSVIYRYNFMRQYCAIVLNFKEDTSL